VGFGVVDAFCASDFGSVGASAAAAPAAAMPAAAMPVRDGDVGGPVGAVAPPFAGATAAAGVTVRDCPCGFVIVTMRVVLLITTVLWMLL
jgi:hypothetical protein